MDAGSQLQATLLLARTGSLASKTRPALEPVLWVLNGQGDYYQCHDIGNILLMLPAAFATAVFSSLSTAEIFAEPPAATRVAVSLT